MKVKFLLCLLFVVAATTFVSLADPGDPGDIGGPAVPLDGGATALLGAGAVYAIRKYKAKKAKAA